MKMKKKLEKKLLGALVGGAFALAAFLPAASVAAPLVVAGDIVKLYDGPGTTGGGEFWADVVGKGVSGAMSATNNDFITFCLEYNESFNYYGQPLRVDGVTTGAVNGGVSGGNPDPISNQTAWLYTQFTNSPGTIGYSHTAAMGNSFQRAIWFLEGELGASYTLAQLNTLDSQAKAWVDQANAANPSGIGNVRVLNLSRQLSTGAWVNAQDQLYITPIPEPETYAMLLAGLGLMGFVARRRRQRATV